MNGFKKAKSSYNLSAKAQAIMRLKIARMLKNTGISYFKRVFEFGAGQDELGFILRKKIKFDEFISSDINNYDLKFDDSKIRFLQLDMNLPLPKDMGKFDLIISNACLQWLNAKDVLPRLIELLNHGGILLIGTFGVRNLHEVRELTGLGLDYICIDELKNILSPLSHLKMDSEDIVLKFDSAKELFLHLKKSGVNTLSNNFYLSKSILKRCDIEFKNSLTYEAVYIFGIK